MEFSLIRANITDASQLHAMQTEAFRELLENYQDFDTNPGNEPLEKTIARLGQTSTYFYFILADGRQAGAIRVVDQGNSKPKRISPLFILPQFRNRGLAQKAILAVQRLHGDTNWMLDTILQEKGSCHLYEKLGYRKTGNTQVINDKMTLIFYQKY